MIQSYLIHYGYVILFFGTIIEGDGTLLAASYLAHRGYFHILAVILLATLATTLANQFYFWISRTHGKALLERKVAEDPRYARLESWVRRRSILLLLLSRFLYGLRTAIPAVCGAVGMPSTTFFVTNLAGAIIWSALIGLGGYFGGHLVALFLQDIRRHEWTVALFLFIGGLGAILWKSRARDLRRAFSALIAPEQLALQSFSLMIRAKGIFVRILSAS